MKVIIFGGSGFLGSHVADALAEDKHNTIIFDKIQSPYLRKSQEMIIGDILDQDKVEKAVRGCDVVYNFAGISDIDQACRCPLDSVKVNVLGNNIILEACRKAGVRRFVFASSIYVYSKSGSFYRSTKQACELLTENYNEVFGLPYTILRYGSLYGPRSDERNFIYSIIKQALSGRKIVREGDGEEVREYIHVMDAAKGSIDILSSEYENECVNITGYQQMKVKDLLLMIKEVMNNDIEIEYKPSKNSYHYEITPYNFSPRLAKRILNKTYFDLGQGILETVYNIHKEMNGEAESFNGQRKKTRQ